MDGLDSSDAVLPNGFWWTEGGPALTQDWESGDFSWHSSTQQAAALGVQFAKQDAEAMGIQFGVSSTASPMNAAKGSKNQGGRKQSLGWPEFVAELCAYFHEKGIPPGSGTEGAEKVIEAVDQRLLQRGVNETPSRSTVQPAVNAALKRLRAEN